MAGNSLSNKKWNEVKTYFITNTAELIKGKHQSLREMANRFGVNVTALSRKADAEDEHNNTWWDLRTNFKSKYSQDSENVALGEIKKRANINVKMLTNLKNVGYAQLLKRIQSETYKISPRELSDIIKLEMAYDKELLPQLISSAIAINLKIDKPITDMTEKEIEGLQERINKFSNGEIEDGMFELVSDE